MLKAGNLDELLTKKKLQPDLPEQQVDTHPDEITLSLTDVRKILAEKSRSGFTDQVRLLLEKYGANRLSKIDPSNYQNLISEAECLGTTAEDLVVAVGEKIKAGYSDQIPAVFEHHNATGLNDLKPEYYAGFLRDIRSLDHE